MINNFLSAIFSFFFWGGMTRDTADNVRHSSWLKTITYLVLTIIVALIYLKTLKVETLMTYVDVRDGNDSIAGNVSIKINTAFEGIPNDYAILGDSGMDISQTIRNLNMGIPSKDFSEEMGLYPAAVSSIYIVHDLYTKNDNVNYTFFRDNSGFEEYYNNLLLYLDSILLTSNLRSYNFVQPRGMIITASKTIPDFNLFKERDKYKFFYNEKGEGEDGFRYSFVISLHNQKQLRKTGLSDSILRLWGENGIATVGLYNMKRSARQGFIHDGQSFPMLLKSPILNSLGVFSAADISQCKYRLFLHSDYPLKNFIVTFNTPVEMSPIPFKVDRMSAYGFEVSDSASLAMIKNNNFIMHLKFPEMANKQLVRSLVLTTILTALASLFLYNFYYVMRRMLEKKEEEGTEKRICEINKRVKVAQWYHNLLCVSILGVLLFFAIRLYDSDPFYIKPNLGLSYTWWLILIICLLLLTFVGVEKSLYDYAHSNVSKENLATEEEQAPFGGESDIDNTCDDELS